MADFLKVVAPTSRHRAAALWTGLPERAALAAGGGTAAAGIALLAVPLFLLWLVTPYAGGGLGGVLRLAACGWLAAHGGPLRHDAQPLGVTPLALTVPLLLAAYHAGRRAGDSTRPRPDEAGAEADANDDADDTGTVPVPVPLPSAGRAAVAVCAGYLTVGLLALAVGTDGDAGTLRAAPLPDLAGLLLTALPALLLGFRRGAALPWPTPAQARQWLRAAPATAWRRTADTGRWLGVWPVREPADAPSPADAGPDTPVDEDETPRNRWVAAARERLRALDTGDTRARLAACFAADLPVAARAGAAGALALLGGGAAVLAVSVVAHFGQAGTTAALLAPDLPGRVALLLLCVVLLPNAAVWAAAYGLGPGFSLGTGAHAAVLGSQALPGVALPLLVEAPAPGRSALGLAALAAPVAAGAVVARFLAVADAASALRLAARAATAAVCTGLLAGAAAVAAGGPLGTHALAHTGPAVLPTAAAATAWTLAVALPVLFVPRLLPSRGAEGVCTEDALQPPQGREEQLRP